MKILKALIPSFISISIVSGLLMADKINMTTPATKPLYFDTVELDELYWKPKQSLIQIVYKTGYVEGESVIWHSEAKVFEISGANYQNFVDNFASINFNSTPPLQLFLSQLLNVYPGEIVPDSTPTPTP